MRSQGLDVFQIFDGLPESEIAAILCHIGCRLYPYSITQYNSKSPKKQLTVWANAPYPPMMDLKNRLQALSPNLLILRR